MDSEKLDEVSAELDDVTVNVEELEEDSNGLARQKLNDVHKAIEKANDIVDEIQDEEA